MTGTNVYQIVTDKVIAQLEAGTAPWRQPWSGPAFAPKNLVSDRRYSAVNAFLLSCEPYPSPYWLTFNQAKKLGGTVKKGEHGTLVIFFKQLEVQDKDTDETKRIPLLRYYRVFNLDQTEDVKVPKGRVTHPEPQTLSESDRKDAAEAVVAGYPNPPKIVEGASAAWYRVDRDLVNVPPRDQFDRPDEFYSTLFHELGHSTAHTSRLDRDVDNVFASHAYGREELVAEMTSTFLAAEAGIDTTVDNSAAYLASWIKTIRTDTHALVSAASQAQKAADHILNR